MSFMRQGRAELLRILEKEFEYYKSSYDSVGTQVSIKLQIFDLHPPTLTLEQAALIAGFTVAVLVTLDISDESRKVDGMHPEDIPTVCLHHLPIVFQASVTCMLS